MPGVATLSPTRSPPAHLRGPDVPGFVFWGLFLVFGLIVVAYVLWMKWVER